MKQARYGWSDERPTYSQRYLLPVVLGLCRPLAPLRVLDVGVGNGSYLPWWLKQGWSVSAMEPDKDGFEIAKNVEGVDLRLLGVDTRLPAEWSGAFDLVISLEVVEHLYTPSDLVKCMGSALKTGGHAIVSTPYHGYAKNLALSIAGKWDAHHHPERAGGHIKFWSRRSLTSLFEAGGLQAVHFRGAGRIPYVWNSMVMVFRKRA
jgi:2-polyprenyl-3-methyl-5-hydroxy-6-metoxy-1,4-benzoquinol methylase